MKLIDAWQIQSGFQLRSTNITLIKNSLNKQKLSASVYTKKTNIALSGGKVEKKLRGVYLSRSFLNNALLSN